MATVQKVHWETIGESDYGTLSTTRLSIPTGWIVRCVSWIGDSISVSMVKIEDPNHTWLAGGSEE